MTDVTLLHGDCLEVLRGLEADSLEACVCDPPYGLGAAPDMLEVLRCWLDGTPYAPKGGGFMGAKWDAFVPGPEVWREVFRVLKPGAHVLAFAGTRTWDVMSLALRLAGFENRDTIASFGCPPAMAWVHATGFPKSLDVSKALDKAAGITDRPISGDKLGAERLRNQAPGGCRDGEGRWGNEVGRDPYIRSAVTDLAKQWAGFGTAMKPAWEVILVFRKPLGGNTVAANVARFGTGAINVDGCRVAGSAGKRVEDKPRNGGVFSGSQTRPYIERALASNTPCRTTYETNNLGRWPANVILSCACEGEEHAADCPVALLDAQSGERPGGNFPSHLTGNSSFGLNGHEQVPRAMGDTGGASRYFFQAKPSRSEREAGCEGLSPMSKANQYGDGLNSATKLVTEEQKANGTVDRGPCRNHHPTAKSITLMRYLVRLVTPPGGTVLDPFAGSGTTGCACAMEGFDAILIEREAEYLPIIRARVAHWQGEAEAEAERARTAAMLAVDIAKPLAPLRDDRAVTGGLFGEGDE